MKHFVNLVEDDTKNIDTQIKLAGAKYVTDFVLKNIRDASVLKPNVIREFYDNCTYTEKMIIVYNILSKLGIKENLIINPDGSTVSDFKYEFIDNWVKAFKWEEICNRNNTFINLLKINKKGPFSKNVNNFLKAYNAYANDAYGIKFITKAKDDFNILFNDTLYEQNEKSVESILKFYCRAWDENMGVYKDLFMALSKRNILTKVDDNYLKLKLFITEGYKGIVIKNWKDILNSYNKLVDNINNNSAKITVDTENAVDTISRYYSKLNSKDKQRIKNMIINDEVA